MVSCVFTIEGGFSTNGWCLLPLWLVTLVGHGRCSSSAAGFHAAPERKYQHLWRRGKPSALSSPPRTASAGILGVASETGPETSSGIKLETAAQGQCSKWVGTHRYAVPALLHFTLWRAVTFSFLPELLTSCRYSSLPSQYQVLWEIHNSTAPHKPDTV